MRYLRAVIILLLVFVAAAHAKKADTPAMAAADCIACHSEKINEETYKKSIHGTVFSSCTDCHTDIKGPGPHEPAPAKPKCATCHEDQQKAYDNGFHAKAIAGGDAQAASCVNCHGGPHELLPASDPASKVSHKNIPATCGACHGQKFVMESSGHSAQPFFSYEESVHGKRLAAGDQRAAVCTDCHGTHEILNAGNPKSPIFKFNVPQTCAKCHGSQSTEFMASIHGQAISRGNWQSPVCTDCHGIHLIKPHVDPTSPVAAQQLARTTCGRCHDGVRLTQEFGVAGRRSTTYLSSYHGMASQLGSNVVANCASCHGVHNILPSSDPKSMIAPANLTKTCGSCHPGATENFTKGKVHIDVPLSADIGSMAVRFIRKFYLLMIAVTVGGMALHNFLIWRKKAVEKRKSQRRIVVRMKRAQRYQHLVLLLSFITLVLTGFALKYPDSWFAAFLLVNETVRGIVHRVAGVVLIGVCLFHVGYVIAARDGRKLFVDLMPTPKDAVDIVGTLKYYLGLSNERPQYARFHYGEKFEYLALVWGMLVMGVTGLALWFKVQVGHFAPRWMLDIATAIHFYEAILATLAILVWHFYEVIIDPDVYPMNWAWYDGKMDIELYHEEHGADMETITEAIEAAGDQQAELTHAGSDKAETVTSRHN